MVRSEQLEIEREIKAVPFEKKVFNGTVSGSTGRIKFKQQMQSDGVLQGRLLNVHDLYIMALQNIRKSRHDPRAIGPGDADQQ